MFLMYINLNISSVPGAKLITIDVTFSLPDQDDVPNYLLFLSSKSFEVLSIDCEEYISPPYQYFGKDKIGIDR